MTLQRASITHTLEATGYGKLTGPMLAELAVMVPSAADVAFEQQAPPDARRSGRWSWSATWPYEEEQAAQPGPSSGKVTAESEDFPSAAELPAAYDDGFVLMGTLDGTNDPRCLVVSDARVERFGYAVGVQCELRLGHSPLRNGAGHKFAKKADQ